MIFPDILWQATNIAFKIYPSFQIKFCVAAYCLKISQAYCLSFLLCKALRCPMPKTALPVLKSFGFAVARLFECFTFFTFIIAIAPICAIHTFKAILLFSLQLFAKSPKFIEISSKVNEFMQKTVLHKRFWRKFWTVIRQKAKSPYFGLHAFIRLAVFENFKKSPFMALKPLFDKFSPFTL